MTHSTDNQNAKPSSRHSQAKLQRDKAISRHPRPEAERSETGISVSKRPHQTGLSTEDDATIPSENDKNVNATKRSHQWLQDQLDTIWRDHFGNVEKLNIVTISWSRVARNRLGSITGRSGTADNPVRSEIRINSLLRNPAIPQSVVWQTIAHELAHYTHGYCSPHPKSVSHPHRGGVIEKELGKRNLGQVYNESEAWLKQHWHNHVHDVIGKPKRRVYARSKPLSLLSHLRKIASSGRRLGK